MKLLNLFRTPPDNSELNQKLLELQENNEYWQQFALQMYKYVQNRINIPTYNNLSDFIKYAYAYNSVVYSVISRRSRVMKTLNWILYKVTDDKKLRQYKSLSSRPFDKTKALQLKEQSLEEISGTEINALIEKPNQYQSFAGILEALNIFRDATGNAYLYKVRNPVTKKVISLHILPADKVKIVAGTFTNPVAGYRIDDTMNDILEPQNVVHWKYYNPMYSISGSQLYGMPPLQAAARVIATDNAAVDSELNAFLNEGVKGIITGTQHTDIEFTKDQGQLLEKNFEKHKGPKNKKNIAFNRAPLNYLKIGETPVDLDTIAARGLNKEDICNVFNIHPALFSNDASTMNNMTNAVKSLVTQSVLPDANDLRDLLNNQLISEFGNEYYIDYDLMAIPELQEDLEKLARTLGLMDWVSKNEKREATGYDKRDEEQADYLYEDAGKIPINEEFNTGFDNIPNFDQE